MTSYALVVGCDHYPGVPGGNLRGAVADALAVRDWLLASAGVSTDHLTFLASPSVDGAPVDPGTRPATRVGLATVVSELVSRADAGPDDRLFVYFAGHGCRTDPLNETLSLDVLALQDFSPIDPAGGSAGVGDLIGRLEQSRFGEVVLITDACRDLPFRQPFSPGRLGLDPVAPTGRPYTPQVYLAQATTPGGVATGDPVASGQIRGDFTSALLDGLTGTGRAKRYDETSSPPYVVTWSTLRAYVEEKLVAQQPRLRGDGEIRLASFPEGYFADVDLEIDVVPEADRTAADLAVEVTYSDPGQFDGGARAVRAPVPQRVSVPPRRHRIRARAGDRRGQIWYDVYADTSIVVSLGDQPPTLPLPHDAPVRRGAGPGDGAVDIIVEQDPAAVVQVTTPGGQVVLDGVGRVRGSLGRADYTVVVTGPDGRPQEHPIEVEEGRLTRIAVPQHLWDPDRRSRSDSAIALLRPISHDPRPYSPAGLVCVSAPVLQSSRGDRILLAVLSEPELGAHLARPRSAQQIEETGGLQIWSWPAQSTWAELSFGSDVRPGESAHRLAVPLLPEALTVVVAGEQALQVSLFDRRPERLIEFGSLLYDRAQVLLGLSRPEQAAVIVRTLGRRSRPGRAVMPVLSALAHASLAQPDLDEFRRSASHDEDIPEPLRRTAPADLRARLLPGTPWAALLDFDGPWSRLTDWRPAPRDPEPSDPEPSDLEPTS